MKRITETEVMATLEEASAYDNIVREYPFWMCRRFAGRVAKVAHGQVLDMGTGPGWVPVELARKRPDLRIVGVDKSHAMLKLARRNAEGQGVADRVTFIHADAREVPFEDGHFDTVISSSFLHQIADPTPVLREIARVSGEDGTVYLEDLVRPSRRLVSLIISTLGRRYNDLMKKEYRDSLYAAFTKEELKGHLDRAGIRRARVRYTFPHFMTIRLGV